MSGKSSKNQRKRRRLRARFGNTCWYCNCELLEPSIETNKLPNVATVEHLEDQHNKIRFGKKSDAPNNLVLACKRCNNTLGLISAYVGAVTVEEKFWLRGKGTIRAPDKMKKSKRYPTTQLEMFENDESAGTIHKTT